MGSGRGWTKTAAAVGAAAVAVTSFLVGQGVAVASPMPSESSRLAAGDVPTRGVGDGGIGPAGRPADSGARWTAPDHDRHCHTTRVPVTLDISTPITPGGPTLRLPALAPVLPRDSVLAKVCLPDHGSPRAVQLLVHGIGYDHRYWNVGDPADPNSDRYSWEDAAAKAGYATVAIDRIGNGASSHPPSLAVTIDSNASVVHQVVQALRDGHVDGAGRFHRVVLVGHSYGSITDFIEADRYHDVDALLLTGVSHHLRDVHAVANIEGLSYPAAADPRFGPVRGGQLLDPGYLTTLPGPAIREQVFYTPGTDFDRRLLAVDDANKGGATQGELLNFPLFLAKKLDIRVPVLIIDGTKDGLFCSQTPLDLGAPCHSERALADSERPFFGPHVPSLRVHLAQGAGHVVDLFHSSQDTFRAAMSWAHDVEAP